MNFFSDEKKKKNRLRVSSLSIPICVSTESESTWYQKLFNVKLWYLTKSDINRCKSNPTWTICEMERLFNNVVFKWRSMCKWSNTNSSSWVKVIKKFLPNSSFTRSTWSVAQKMFWKMCWKLQNVSTKQIYLHQQPVPEPQKRKKKYQRILLCKLMILYEFLWLNK